MSISTRNSPTPSVFTLQIPSTSHNLPQGGPADIVWSSSKKKRKRNKSSRGRKRRKRHALINSDPLLCIHCLSDRSLHLQLHPQLLDPWMSYITVHLKMSWLCAIPLTSSRRSLPREKALPLNLSWLLGLFLSSLPYSFARDSTRLVAS